MISRFAIRNLRYRRAAPACVLISLSVAMAMAMIGNVRAADAPTAAMPDASVTRITGLFSAKGERIDSEGGANRDSAVGLNDALEIQIDPSPQADSSKPLDAGQYALYLNGAELPGLEGTTFDHQRHALVFHLARSDKNASLWTALLGSPTRFHVPVTVSLVRQSSQGQTSAVAIRGNDANCTFQLQVISGWRLTSAVVAVVLVALLVWGRARHSTTLRDNLLPQIAPGRQT